MALTQKSLFLYGYTVTTANRNLDFRAVALETPRQAVLRLGYYSLSGIMREVVRSLQAADPLNAYACTADRTLSGGLENRVTIATSGTLFSLLFASGPNTGSNCATLLGFTATDKTGSLTYTGTSTTGTTLLTDRTGYNYLPVTLMQNVTGSMNVAVSGVKEAVVLNIQSFWQVQFKYVASADAITAWASLFQWMIQARSIDFTPEYTSPSVIYEGTLETQIGDSRALGYKMPEMLPSFPNLYDTGLMKFRQRLST